MTPMLNAVQQQWIASLALVDLVMREMVLPAKVSILLGIRKRNMPRMATRGMHKQVVAMYKSNR